MEKSSCKVCVTGGAGYIGSSLVKKLLNEGYTVHATLRNLNDNTKVDPLKNFCGAEERLKLFEANIYRAEEFEPAIQGCQFVFHVATPLLGSEGQKKQKSMTDATLDAAKSIAAICIRSGTVRRLIYTASVMSASPLKEDGSGYKEFMDETCWTPSNLHILRDAVFLKEYISAKSSTERELLGLNNSGIGGMEVVTLACALVGGENPLPPIPGSVDGLLSPVTNMEFAYNSLKIIEDILAKVPIVHIEDVCNAHIFCMKEESMSGRFLCANAYVSIADIANYYKKKHPQRNVKKGYLEGPRRETKWGSSLLTERGFEYKYEWRLVLDDCINSARENGYLEL